jgi:hypothetical protein
MAPLNSLIDVLIFVQDPGAANYVAPLAKGILDKGLAIKVLTDGIARDHLTQRGIANEPISPGMSAADVIDEYAPRLLVVGTACNPDTFAFPLIHAARDAGIQSIGLIDAAMNHEKRFSGRSVDALFHAPDWIFVSDCSIKKMFVDLGAPVDHVIECGHPHYDYVCELGMKYALEDRKGMRTRLFPGLKPGQKVIIFISEASARLDPLSPEVRKEFTFSGRGLAKGRTEVILEELLDAARLLEDRPFIVLRAHPKDAPNDYAKYEPELDMVSYGGEPHEMLYAADLVVGMTSMSLIEATLMNRPALAVIPRATEKKWIPSFWRESIPYVTNRDALKGKLDTMLASSDSYRTPEYVMQGSINRNISVISKILSE